MDNKMRAAPRARNTLKAARKAASMTQQAVADELGISLRYYQEIEDGQAIGSIWVWDALEDLFEVHQRTIRQTPDIDLFQEANQQEH